MHYYMFLFSSFQGRISRVDWWIGIVILGIAGLFKGWVVGPEPTNPIRVLVSWPHTLWNFAWLVPAAALNIKRFNDRDRPSWVGQMFVAMAVIFNLSPHFDLFILPSGPGPGFILFWISAPVVIWMFIDNALCPGIRGPNRFGPDPLSNSAETKA